MLIDSYKLKVNVCSLLHRGARSARYDWLAHGHVTSARGYHVVLRRVSGGLQCSLSNDKKLYLTLKDMLGGPFIGVRKFVSKETVCMPLCGL